MIKKFKGCFPAIATPTDSEEKVDSKGLRKLVNKVINAGVDGVVVLGTAGEGPMLEPKEKYRAIEIVVDEVNGRVPVIAGTGDVSTKAIKKNNKQAAKLGASAALVVPPFYFNQNQQSIINFFKDLAQEGSLPILMYNIPMTSKIYLEPDTVKILSQEQGIIGIKDSSGNFNNFQTIIDLQSDEFVAFQGMAPLVCASLILGAAGSITPVPNVAPELEIALHKAVKEKDILKAKELQAHIKRLVRLWAYGGPITTVLKAILYLQGVCEYVPIKPNPKLDDKDLEALRKKLLQLNLID